MKKALACVASVAVVILVLSARAFDTPTVFFIGASMLVLAFFAASTVMLGVLSRRAGKGRRGAENDPGGQAEVIRDDEPRS